MIAVIQRVSEARVTVNTKVVAAINKGLLIFIGIAQNDTKEDVDWLVKKIINLRIFNDALAVMNKSIINTQGDIIIVSQFTLYASTKKGNRPSYIKAASFDVAKPIYKSFIKQVEKKINKKIQSGKFGAEMQISLINDGPVTIIIDTKNKI